MDPLSLRQIAEFAGGSLTGGDPTLKASRITTDSRKSQAGDLFVALRGDSFDGHKFVEQARDRGAVGAMVEEEWLGEVPTSVPLIRVRDTLIGYENLAEKYRKSLPLKVVAITGSN